MATATMGPQKKKRKLSNEKSTMSNQPQGGIPQVEKAEQDQRRSLFVRSLPASVTSERLAEYFSQSFPVKHATVVVEPKSKISKGYGFVTFTDADDAQAAAVQLNNSSIDGRKIKVEVAESRQRDTEDGEKKGVNTTAERLKAARTEQQKDSHPPRLIVRNLPWSIKEPEDLANLFRSYGKVKHAIVPTKSPRMQYGFGIVIIRGKKNAERALAGVNGKEVDGRVLAVDWAVDKATWEQIQQEGARLETGALPSDEGHRSLIPNDAEGQDGLSADSDPTHEQEAASPETGVIDSDQASEQPDEDGDESEAASSSPASDDGQAKDQNNTTVFIRNLPYEVDDEALKEHFQTFGAVRYARVVYDHETERSRGTGFVCFFNEEDSKSCVISAPKKESAPSGTDKKRYVDGVAHSVLQNDAEDPTGRYTLEGRVLQVSRALNKVDADRRAGEASDKRLKRDGDTRRLYLLSEGTISKSSKLYSCLSKPEIDVRESSAGQRQKLIKSNPNLGLSLTRLSVRNIPRHINSKDLKALAREAIVGFSKDVSDGIREPLSREELHRGGDAMKEAEKQRKEKGVGVVKQAKVVFEGREGGKVKDGAGRSRGYGFLEYHTHRNALAGLRWLNGHLLKPKEGSGENAKRLIVEFAIENAQVVQRRTEREKQAVERGQKTRPVEEKDEAKRTERKRKRHLEEESEAVEAPPDQNEKNHAAKRNRIIAKKRAMRKSRKG